MCKCAAQETCRIVIEGPELAELKRKLTKSSAIYFSEKNKRGFSVYDFGNNWQHLVEVKKVVKLPEDFAIRERRGRSRLNRVSHLGTMAG